jgi:DNA recombination protein RmuC
MTTEWLTLALALLVTGLALGFVVGYWWLRVRLGQTFVRREEVEERYVHRGVHDSLQEQTDLMQANYQEKVEAERQLSAELAAARAQLEHLQLRVTEQVGEMKRLQEESRLSFENIANRLLEEKSQKFTQQNQAQLQHLLDPLREKIKTFEENIQRRYLDETKDRISLKKEIENLRSLNQQLSEDAGNLAAALKGDNKTQGDWGEMQLERLLERAGLQKGVHFETQTSLRDSNGQLKRPDFIINLPDEKHLIIDAKVSLTAYDRFCQAEEKAERSSYLKAHLDSLRTHIRELSAKNYQQLYQIHSPDYILLFVPIEPAFALAVQEDHQLFLEALERNVVLVTNSTLLATMRTVSFIWKQDKQKRSVMEIARQSGLLYDKFCNFVEDLQSLGQRLDQAQRSYQDAMYKLADGKRYGDTLVGRAEKLRRLGARTTKQLPATLRRSEEEE